MRSTAPQRNFYCGNAVVNDGLAASWDAGQVYLASRLRNMGYPAATITYLVTRCGAGWVAPDQALMVPGCIYHVEPKDTHELAQPSETGAARGASTPLSTGSATEALREAYTVHRVTPLQLRRIVLSTTMMSDHSSKRYASSLSGLMQLAALAGMANEEAEQSTTGTAGSNDDGTGTGDGADASSPFLGCWR